MNTTYLHLTDHFLLYNELQDLKQIQKYFRYNVHSEHQSFTLQNLDMRMLQHLQVYAKTTFRSETLFYS